MTPEDLDFLVNTAYHLGKKHTLEVIGNMVPNVLDEAIELADQKYKQNVAFLPEIMQTYFANFDKSISLSIITGMWNLTTDDES